MRILLAILTSMIVLLSTTAKVTAQTHLPVPVSPYMPLQPASFVPWEPWLFSNNPAFVPFDNTVRQLQWIPYASVSTGFIFWNGSGISYLSTPAGLTLIRPLNNNLAAFAGLSVAPTLWSSAYYDPAINSPAYNLQLNTRIEGGLRYTNDAKTFSISGSVSVERGGYPLPVYPYAGHPKNYPRSY